MTVTYMADVASTSRGMSGFWKLLFRWRGSLYKLVWREFLVYCLLYTTLSLVYRLALEEEQKRVFEKVTLQVNESTQMIPMTFVLGFYVSLVMSRWWGMYISLPWPDSVATFITTNILGKGEKERVMRRTLMRYVNLTYAMALSEISPPMKKRFPTLEHFLVMGLLKEKEMEILKKFKSEDQEPKLPLHWIPIQWAIELGYRAREQELLKDDVSARVLGDKLNLFRNSCGDLFSYDYINIPLVYTQVVTIAVYTFFLSTLMGRQFLDPSQNIPGHYFDTYVPVFTLMQFFFYMGWLKVAESLCNPFGEDDDDFELCFLLDRNIKMSYVMVDLLHGSCPDHEKDHHFTDVVPKALVYTEDSDTHRLKRSFQGSAHSLKVEGPNVMLNEQEIKSYIAAHVSSLQFDETSSVAEPSQEPGGRVKPQDFGSPDDSDSSVDSKDVRVQIGSGEGRRNKGKDADEDEKEGTEVQKEEYDGTNACMFNVDFADGGKGSQVMAPWYQLTLQNAKADRNGRQSYSLQNLRERRVAAANCYRCQLKQQRQQEENKRKLNQTKQE